MEGKFKFIDSQGLYEFLKLLKEEGYILHLPQKITEKDYSFAKNPQEYSLNPYRCLEPLRTFINPFLEEVGKYFQSALKPEIKRQLIVGIKNCDLFSLKIQDYIFLEGACLDPVYKEKRENTILISSDCTLPKDVCFCRVLRVNPYPEEGFDLNISLLNRGILIEIGSPKGEALINKFSSLWTEPGEELLKERDEQRKRLSEEMDNQLKDFPDYERLYQAVKKGYDSPIFKEEALRCVECGACVFSCPTCHCFFLYDERKNKTDTRTRIWDACQFKNFMKEAGGVNPLERRFERLRNRYIKKFEFFWENLNLYACTGCGRCIDACIGKIDIGKILKTLVEEADAARKG